MIDRKAFFASVRRDFGALVQDQVDGFNLILDEFERRGSEFSIFDLADMLATAWWETGKTMQPVREAFYVSKDFKTAEAWRKRNLRYYPYYGRGFVQLTWLRNYQLAGRKLGIDLAADPDRVMEPRLAVAIMFDGMKEGWFTGKALDDYIDDIDEGDAEDLREYINARRIINGTDKAATIGQIALKFERALKAADRPVPAPTPTPMPPQPDDPGPVTPPAKPRKGLAGSDSLD
jgi:putative chitinase